MKKNKDGAEWHGKITYLYNEEQIEDPGDVEEQVQEAQDIMANGLHWANSDEVINLEIESPDVPDLTLIDLPSIVRVAETGQPENTGDQIKRLIHKFISKQETICLVVVPSNVDIATTEALKMAQEVDPDGERTLGILTKPDLVDEGTEDTVLKIVNNEVVHLKKGYMIVRCQGQKEITEQVSLTEAIEREKAFFKDHAYFHSLYSDGHATVPKLAEKLTIELVHHIQRSLPRLEEQIEEKIAQTQAELEKYGTRPPSDAAERLVFLTDKITTFSQDAISLTTGEELKFGERLDVFAMSTKEFEKWKNHLHRSGEMFNKRIDRDVVNHKKYHGELSNINYDTFEVMVKEQIQLLEEPAVKKLKNISDAVTRMFLQLAQCSFIGFPNLMNTTKKAIKNIGEDNEKAAESMLRTQFKMELTVYSQDISYIKKTENGKKEGDIVNTVGAEANLKELMKHLKSYYQVVVRRLADQIPLVIRYKMLQEYAIKLQKEMLRILQDSRKIEYLLKEDTDTGNERANLQSHLNFLTEARTYLLEF
ncbi:interferon-induced GTP-binding protein Mx-like isoform X2 [Betta splendens]|nr:interferon-induced GTP-binding protein Mx-like isoform X2 [Betta splendens]